MMILTNGLTDRVDEGFLKVANTLVKLIKNANSDITVVAYNCNSDIADYNLKLNKLLLNKNLISIFKKEKNNLLYIPSPENAISTALRIFILSVFSKVRIKVILSMKTKFSFFSKILLNLSGAEIIVFSNSAAEFYKKIISPKKVIYIKTGVDIEKFVPVSSARQKELKVKYGISPEKKVVLHVGHLKSGRNIIELTKISTEYQVLLVISERFKHEQDKVLRNELEAQGNIKILDKYIPNIEEIYQLSDVYFFPVKDDGNCIDVPLSCLEAASCNKPVVTTNYGEMGEFINKDGFYFIEDFDDKKLNELIKTCTDNFDLINTRQAIVQYDWQNAANLFSDIN